MKLDWLDVLGGIALISIFIFSVLYIPGLVIPILLFVILLIVFYIYKKRKKNVKQIPEDIQNDFEYAQRRWTDNGGQIDPTTILWEVAKSRQRFADSQNRERAIEIRHSNNEPISERGIVQKFNDNSSPEYSRLPTRNKSPSRKGIFRRR